MSFLSFEGQELTFPFITFQSIPMRQTQRICSSDEKFNLNYLTFNLPNSKERISEITAIFHRHGFNSNIYHVETEKNMIILKNKSFWHTLSFRVENTP